MGTVRIAVVSAFMKPPENVDIVLFSGGKRYYIPEETAQQMIGEAQKYACQYGVYVIPEMFLLKSVLNCCIINPKGRVIGASTNAFINLRYRGEVAKGKGASVISTALGKIGLVVDTDICYPQTAKALRLGGAELIIAVTFMERMDFQNEMITYTPIAASLDARAPVLWCTSPATVLVDENGNLLENFGWILPYVCSVNTAHTPLSLDEIRGCRRIIEGVLSREAGNER